MIIDFHVHLGNDPAYGESQTAEELVGSMDKAGINRAVVFPFVTDPEIERANGTVRGAISKYPDRLVGFCAISARADNMIDLMQMCRSEGFVGVMTDPIYGLGFGEKSMQELVECAIDLDLPVFIHTDDKDSPRVDIFSLQALMTKYPHIRFVVSSMFYGAGQIAVQCRNSYIDTSSMLSGEGLASLAMAIGTNRILLGSNSPYALLERERMKVELAEGLSRFQRTLILGRNAQAFLEKGAK